MFKFYKWLLSKPMKTFNIAPGSRLSYLLDPIPFDHAVIGKDNWISHVQRVKLSMLALFTDISTKSKESVLILYSPSAKIDLAKLIIHCREKGMKTWVLESRTANGSLSEFELAMSFIKDKPQVIACGTWINFIQASRSFNSAFLLDPKFDIKSINTKISSQSLIQETTNTQNTKTPKLVALPPLIPELNCQKPLFLYMIRPHDPIPPGNTHPGLIDNRRWLSTEPLGSRELFIIETSSNFHASIKLH